MNGNIRSLTGRSSRWFCHGWGSGHYSQMRGRAVIGKRSGLRCIMMLALGRQCLFPFSPVRVIACVNTSGPLCGSVETNQRRGEGSPWMRLDRHNTCVSGMKRTSRREEKPHSEIDNKHSIHGNGRVLLTCIYEGYF